MNEQRMTDDPGTPLEVQRLLRAAEADGLDDEQRARVAARLATAGVLVAASATSAAALKKGVLVLWGKWLAALSITTMLVGGVAMAVREPPRASKTPVSAIVTRAAPSIVSAAVSVEPPVAEPTPSLAPSAEPQAPAIKSSKPQENPAAMLVRARKMLDTDPASAKALCLQHQKQWPDQLVPERNHILREAEKRLTAAP